MLTASFRSNPGLAPGGDRFAPALPTNLSTGNGDNQALVAELRQLFMTELDANRFEPLDDTGHVFAAHWG